MVDPEDTVTPDMLESADTEIPFFDRLEQLEKIFNRLLDETGRSGEEDFQLAQSRFKEAIMWLQRGLKRDK